ncbi:MAG TPA: sialate O-acetylesterase [Rhizomicrobium sp.]|jgi:hypothetical protein
MRLSLALIGLIALLTASPVLAASGPVDVFLIAGQSNALGEGDSTQAPTVTNGDVFQYFNNVLTTGNDPVGGAHTGSAWPAFGNVYYTLNNRRVVLVPFAFASTAQQASADAGFGNWAAGGTLLTDSMIELDRAMNALTSAGYTPAFKGVLWSQGETDSEALNSNKAGVTAQGYEDALKAMLAAYRAHYGATMPFYLFKTGTQVGASDAGYHAIREAQEDVGQSDPYTYVVFRNAYDFWWRTLMSNAIHYTQTGYNEMGTQGAANVSFYRAHNVGPKPPAAFPGSGTYATVTNVTLASALSSSILYTLDGSIPTCTVGTHYTAPIAIPAGAPTILQAVGCRLGLASPVANYSYNYTVSFPNQPQASPTPGTYRLGVTATLSSPNATSIHWAWMGAAVPISCAGGYVYSGPITLTASHDSFTAIACTGPYASSIGTFGYTVTK